MSKRSGYIMWFSDIEQEDKLVVGDVAYKLGDLTHAGFPVPNGFIISPHAYIQFFKQNNITTKIKHLLATNDYTRPESLLETSSYIKKYIMQAPLSDELVSDIFQAYRRLSGAIHHARVTVSASEVTGESNVILKIKEAWASEFTPQAILHRQEKNINHFKTGATVIIQKILKPEFSGTMTTMNTATNDKTKIIVEIKKNIAIVSKHDLLISKKSADLALFDKQIIELATLGKRLEHHLYFPQQINWTIEKGKNYITQVSPSPHPSSTPVKQASSSLPLVRSLKGEGVIVPSPSKTATKLYISLDKPDHVEKLAKINSDGVFVSGNTDHLETVCKAFSPRPVIYCASDLPVTNIREPNPLLGYHGAFRMLHNSENFKHELVVIRELRNKHNLKNIWLLLPFVRNVRELIELKKIISATGLYRSPTFKLWIQIDVPANVVSLDNFYSAGIDGIAIGSDTLASLMLGVDKNNDEVASAFDELNPALLWAYETIIQTAHKHRITTSIIGQAPSHQMSLVEKLVAWGISSIAITPNMVEQTRETIAQVERKLITKQYAKN